ncbi:hypothetical protein ILYODFUR_032181 [Ilyodon furcidens]|uniref:Uncharacterized protein n=1 Tax=Ilyodon furcidens TaxID=33524 RepID=A0ABV0U2C9_9TELE
MAAEEKDRWPSLARPISHSVILLTLLMPISVLSPMCFLPAALTFCLLLSLNVYLFVFTHASHFCLPFIFLYLYLSFYLLPSCVFCLFLISAAVSASSLTDLLMVMYVVRFGQFSCMCVSK